MPSRSDSTASEIWRGCLWWRLLQSMFLASLRQLGMLKTLTASKLIFLAIIYHCTIIICNTSYWRDATSRVAVESTSERHCQWTFMQFWIHFPPENTFYNRSRSCIFLGRVLGLLQRNGPVPPLSPLQHHYYDNGLVMYHLTIKANTLVTKMLVL